ncbi:hypothetical protein CC78DRAFT_577431 [Lojkania enalia]|uniref:F-box domain-containing protein n=1 Tax=Lojkania enalia TaxID=147567 RepID=A0A9P4KDI4_9PLEO|nr:hypothetical protein CC78DRAFT_577431 [Didymosphaeria enalia]
MAVLNDIPNELLLAIVNLLGQGDVFCLCFVSRKFQVVGQDVLYRRPSLKNPNDDPTTRKALGLLFRTLFSRPDISERVKKMQIMGFDRTGMHYSPFQREWCLRHPQSCCGWPDIRDTAMEFLTQRATDTMLQNVSHVDLIRYESQSAFVGMLLAATPNLESLTIAPTISKSDLGNYIFPRLHTAPHIDPAEYFGSPIRQLDHIPGFSRLKSFTSNVLIPWVIISLPSLQTLKFHLQNYCFGIIPSVISIPSHSTYPLPAFKTLRVGVDIDVLFPGRIGAPHRIYAYFKDLLRHLPKLQHLFIEITREEAYRLTPPNNRGCYTFLANIIQHETLETLVIDTSNMVTRSPLWDTELRFLRKLRPAETFQHLPGLHRLCAPQEMFFYVDGLVMCELPPRIEKLEIIDRDPDLYKWIEMLQRHHGGKTPMLREIRTWKDRGEAKHGFEREEGGTAMLELDCLTLEEERQYLGKNKNRRANPGGRMSNLEDTTEHNEFLKGLEKVGIKWCAHPEYHRGWRTA